MGQRASTGATVEYLDGSDAAISDASSSAPGHQVSLDTGANTIKVKVTALDGSTTETYTVTVTRALSADATLSEFFFADPQFSLSIGTWNPTFASGTTTYTATVDNSVTSVTVQAIPTNSAATVEILPADSIDFVALHQVSLDVGTNTVTATVTAEDGMTTQTYTVTVTRTPAGNVAPEFPSTSPNFSIPENTAANTNVGTPVTATDANSDTLEYSLSPDDSFTINSGTGQIRTKTGASYDYETQDAYTVTVTADDGNGGTDSIDVRIEITNVDEQSAKPAAPTVRPTSGSLTSLDVIWIKPGLNGGPEITGYSLQYRQGTSGSWNDQSHSGTVTTATITGLTEDTLYQARVRAENGETVSDWSDPGEGRTGAAAPNNPPQFSGSQRTFSMAENTSANTDVGNPVTATDVDSDPLRYTLEGDDASSFTIDSASGQISTRSGADYNYEVDDRYSITVKADDNRGGAATISVLITLNDVDEPPGRPDPPTVNPTDNDTMLDVSWLEPSNTGPDITGYEVQYRQGDTGDWNDWSHTGTGTSATITGLSDSGSYQVRVRAANDEGIGDWSQPGSAGVEGQLRLVDKNGNVVARSGSDPADGPVVGRLEVFHAGRWGTVCNDRFERPESVNNPDKDNTQDDEWTNVAPRVACLIMGYENGRYEEGHGQPGLPSQHLDENGILPYWSEDDTYPADDPVPIWLDDVNFALKKQGEDTYLSGQDLADWLEVLAHDRCSYTGWGLHNCVHEEDAGLACWKDGDDPPVSDAARAAEPLRADFEGRPAGHDGKNPFTLRLAFSDDVTVSASAMRDHALTVNGARVTNAARVDGRSDLWSLTVTPSGTENIELGLTPGRECKEAGALCTGDGRQLSIGRFIIISFLPPLTVGFEDVPNSHDGETTFSIKIAFSEDVDASGGELRNYVLATYGGQKLRVGPGGGAQGPVRGHHPAQGRRGRSHHHLAER